MGKTVIKKTNDSQITKKVRKNKNKVYILKLIPEHYFLQVVWIYVPESWVHQVDFL